MGYSIYTVKNAFEEIVSGNNTARSRLESAMSDTAQKRNALERQYHDAIEDVILLALANRKSASETLQKISHAIREGVDLDAILDKGIANSEATEREYKKMIAEYGEISAVESKIAAYNKKLEALNKAAENQISIQSDHQFALRGVIAFNEQCAKNGKPKLDAVGISHYAKKTFLQHAFSIMLDSTYSRARGLIEMLGGEKKILERQFAIENARVKEADYERQIVELGKKDDSALVKPLREMYALRDKCHSEDVLTLQMKDTIFDYLRDSACFNRVAAALGEQFPAQAVFQRTKIESLKKVETSLSDTLKILRDANEKIEKHLPKLRTASYRNGSHYISIDLDQIKSSFKKLQEFSIARANNVKDLAKGIDDFKFDASQLDKLGVTDGFIPSAPTSSIHNNGGPDFLQMYMTFMMLDMISNDDHRHIDNALIHSNFGDISDDISRAASGFDVSDSISNSFNNIDPVRFEVPDTNFSVPDVHVPDVHVPDISIPDTTSFDSGGGFDAGGGCD